MPDKNEGGWFCPWMGTGNGESPAFQSPAFQQRPPAETLPSVPKLEVAKKAKETAEPVAEDGVNTK